MTKPPLFRPGFFGRVVNRSLDVVRSGLGLFANAVLRNTLLRVAWSRGVLVDPFFHHFFRFIRQGSRFDRCVIVFHRRLDRSTVVTRITHGRGGVLVVTEFNLKSRV